VYAGWKPILGKTIILDHGFGYVTRYGHLSAFACRNGQQVKRGAIIGALGETGRATGYHLHYEVRLKGVAMNPRNYMLN